VIKSYQTAQILALELLDQARENEPQITVELKKIAQQVSAKIVGLGNKFKMEESLIRKLIDKSYGNVRKLPKKAETINDVLRYTFVLPIKVYANAVRQTVEKLSDSGYQVPEHKIWNAWQIVGSEKDRGYRGINCTVISSNGQKFELQFHTGDSFVLKTQTHYLYVELRDRKISGKRETELINILREMAGSIKRPEGI
jgi:hypothetical protein